MTATLLICPLSCNPHLSPTADCGAVLTRPTGRILPELGEDGTYLNNSDCSWEVQVESGRVLQFEFVDLRLENSLHVSVPV